MVLVKGRKKRERKLGIRLAISMARRGRRRVCGESFRVSVGMGLGLGWGGWRKVYSVEYLLLMRLERWRVYSDDVSFGLDD